MTYLVTGAAGFIGYYVCDRLCKMGYTVTGLDNLSDYYDVNLKQARLKKLENHKNFSFIKMDLSNRNQVATLFSNTNIRRVIHLAAQAGVRYSLENPFAYHESNLSGMLTILEGCRRAEIEHLVYASSSSVYGMNSKLPFAVTDNTDNPISLYAATKKANELMAHAYAHLYNIPTTGLRFFTVYGPWGRPDMAPFIFTKAILEGAPIQVFNQGKMQRDFTYIDDVVEGIIRIQDHIPSKHATDQNMLAGSAHIPHRLYNIGNSKPIELSNFIRTIEIAANKNAIKEFLPMQPGDVLSTYADVSDLQNAIEYKPTTDIETGIGHLVKWYREFYNV